MRDENFEWDDDKAARNRLDHGISFEMARDVFKDIFAVEWTDMGQDGAEARFAIGHGGEQAVVRCLHDEGRRDPHHLGPTGRTIRAPEVSQ